MYELDEFDPFRHMKRMHKRMNSFFNFPEAFEKESREPLIDIRDKGKELEVVAELPGIDKEDIKMNLLEDSLVLNAESKSEEKQEKEGYYYHERSFNSFNRSIPLPEEVVPDKSKAEFKNGILTLTVSKKHPEKKKADGFEVKIE